MRYKIIRIITLIWLLLALNVTGVLAAENTSEFAGGEGTEVSPYLVATAEQLDNVRDHLSSHFKLINDIFFTEEDFAEGGTFYNSGYGFLPIGSEITPFMGSFDGNHHTISGLYIYQRNTTTDLYVGLFRCIKNASVQNLGIVDAEIRGDCHGYSSYYPPANAYTGAVAGSASASTISNCYSTGFIQTRILPEHEYAYTGGIVGRMKNGGTLSGCYNAATVSGKHYAGGLVGAQEGESVPTIIRNCFNIGSVSSENYAGGIAAYINNKNCTLECCYNIGAVSSKAINKAGALLGAMPYTVSYADPFINCYYLDNCSVAVNASEPASAVCYNRDDMLMASSFTGFDFTNVWTMDGHSDYFYPKLKNATTIFTKSLASISVSALPNKTLYHVGDMLSEEGLVISALYYGGASIPVTGYELSYDFSAVGETSVTVTYEGLTTMFPVTVCSNAFQGGFGTEEYPYLITTAEQLDLVRDYLSSHFKLTSDIVFTDADFAEGGAFYNNGEGFVPIGGQDTPFTGSFDGNSHIISGLYINPAQKNADLCAALFYRIEHASIQNLGMVNAKIDADYSASTISNCSYGATIAAFASASSITNCYSTGSVSATMRSNYASAFAGGLVAYMSDGGTLSGCYNAATVYGTNRAGGLIGMQEGETDQTVISNCFNIGSVSSKSSAGGLAATINNRKFTVDCFYNIGAISTDSTNGAGGLVRSLPYSLSVGNPFTSCYYLDNCSRAFRDDNGIVNTAERVSVLCYDRDAMLKESSFKGFDFENVWTMAGHSNYFYPELRAVPTVYSSTLVSISVSSLPNQTMYHIGDTVSEEGLVINALYDNGVSVPVTDYALSYDLSAIGEATVTVTYKDKTTIFPVSVYTNEFQDGFGTEEFPYLIATTEQLNNVRNYPAAHFKMTTDIAFTASDFAEGGAFYNEGKGWQPIGEYTSTENPVFNGVFDGNGYTITGLQINLDKSSDCSAVGLFGYVTKGTICNLGMVDTSITYTAINTSPGLGSIVGTLHGGSIINCFSTGNISVDIGSSSYGYFGGIVGKAHNNSTIVNCYNTASVYTIARGDIRTGGIAGLVVDSYVENCFNVGSVNIENIYESGVGGITGSMSSSTISNCYNAAGTVVAARKPTNSSDSWAEHEVYVGGITGIASGSTFTNCYYMDTCTAGVGKNTQDSCVKCTVEQLKNKDTFVGFDFETVWTMDGHADYLYPELQGSDTVFTKCLTEISVVSPPENLLYYTDSQLETSGLTVKAIYNNGTAVNITDYELSYDFSKVGTAKVTVSYEGCSDTFTVRVSSREFDGGYGTEELPYLISTKQQLDAVRKYPYAHYQLIADIRFTEADFAMDGAFFNNGASFAPIKSFTGSFDGNGYTVSGLSINYTASGAASVGLFERVQDASISNLTLENLTITASGSGTIYVGSIAGSAVDTSIINCSCSGSITGTSTSGVSYTGGIVGQTDSEVRGCSNTASVTSSSHAGGIAAKLTGSIIRCYNTGIVSGSNSVGAIVGVCSNGSITACCYLADATTEAEGLAGAGCSCSDHGLFAVADFSTGEAAYHLNTSLPADSVYWYQTIGKDALPVLDSTHALVYCYQSGGCTEESYTYAYSNQKKSAVTTHSFRWEHTLDSHWEECIYCQYSLPSEAHKDTPTDHICDLCQATVSTCQDHSGDHICDLCRKICSVCIDENNDHICDICKVALSECTDADHDHNCDLCAKVVSECFDSLDDTDHNCDICGKVLSECTDVNSDHSCDICSITISLCVDDNGDHHCDLCGVAVSVCSDTNMDHLCDSCSAQLSVCQDDDDDFFCDICGADLNVPIPISSAAELAKIGAEKGYSLKGSYYLTENIVLPESESWTPIGTEDAPFTGVFDGNGYTITGLYINTESSDPICAGLFGVVENGTIRNLGMMNTDITVTGSSSIYAGGIIGLFRGDGLITDCFNTGNVIVKNTKDTSESIYAGGIAGSAYTGFISNSYNVGTIMMTSDCTGSNKFGQSFAGGIVGYTSASITDCYNAGSISTNIGTMTSFTGGIAGQNISPISNCYNIGSISASGSTIRPSYTGGIVAYSQKKVTNCYYWDTSASDDGGGAVKRTTAQMHRAGAYAGFDFEDVWTMAGLTDYPCPELQNVETHYSKKLQSISITSLPRTTFYDIDDRLDTTGLEVTALYDNTATAVVTDYELTYDFSAAGEAIVTVTFEGKSAVFVVCVNDGLFSGGLGTTQYPYFITSAEDLNLVRSYPAAHFKMAADIVFSQADFSRGGAFYNSGAGWVPIGSRSTPFTGAFDGAEHTITGLQINLSEAASYVSAGLFGEVEYADICNLTLRNVNISVDTDTSVYVGGIVGIARNAEIEGCSVSGTIYARSMNTAIAGSIVGHTVYSTISYCSSTAVVTAESNHNDDNSDYNAYAGGIVGNGETLVTVNACYYTGFVTAESLMNDAYAGGIVGGDCSKITNSFNAGSVTAKAYDNGSRLFPNWATAGGIAGENGDTITCCYNIGDVTVDTGSSTVPMVRGITGYASWPKQISNCYYVDSLPHGVYTSTSHPDTSVRCSSWQMTQPSTFRGFDFSSVWTMGDSSAYPYPVLQGMEMEFINLNAIKTDDGVRVSLSLPANILAKDVSLMVAAYDEDGRLCDKVKMYTADALNNILNSNKEITFSQHDSCTVFLTDLNFRPLIDAFLLN